VQVPQSIDPPQPSPTTPQYFPFAWVHWVGVQTPESRAAPQTPGVPPPPQVWPPVQVPQSIDPPQPSPTTPQSFPFEVEQLVTVQVPESRAAPHTLAMPAPPQLCPPVQPPQSCWPPQPSPTTPQYFPLAWLQLVGVQAPESGADPQTFGMPSPPHVCGLVQPPQSC
jgi:hypothetical protein